MMHRKARFLLVFFLLGCVLMTGCTADKTPETHPETEAPVETTQAPETTVPTETANPELEAGFVAIDPEEQASVPMEKADDNKDDAPQKEETVLSTTEPKKEDPKAVHVPNMGDLVP